MSKETSIKKIVFNVRGKTLELNAAEAKELKEILSDMFGETKYVYGWHYKWPYYHGPCWSTITSTISDRDLPSGNIANGISQTTDTVYLNAVTT